MHQQLTQLSPPHELFFLRYPHSWQHFTARREWYNLLCVYLRRLLLCLASEGLETDTFRGHSSQILHPINLLMKRELGRYHISSVLWAASSPQMRENF